MISEIRQFKIQRIYSSHCHQIEWWRCWGLSLVPSQVEQERQRVQLKWVQRWKHQTVKQEPRWPTKIEWADKLSIIDLLLQFLPLNLRHSLLDQVITLKLWLKTKITQHNQRKISPQLLISIPKKAAKLMMEVMWNMQITEEVEPGNQEDLWFQATPLLACQARQILLRCRKTITWKDLNHRKIYLSKEQI